MLFNSYQFLVFFPIASLGYYIVPHRIRYIWLLACSYYFYMCWNPGYALLILFSTVITWTSGILLEQIKMKDMPDRRRAFAKKLCILFCFVLNLGVLAYFKYANFFINTVNYIFRHLHFVYQMPTFDVLLPVGISFYTFQALSYTIDIYRDEISAEKNILRYALFVSFFPQLVAGPIERSKSLLRQLKEEHKFSFKKARSGFMLMIWGFFLKMVIADRAAIIVDTIYGNYTTYTGWYLIVATVLFAVQILCDFAGYSTIAMGAAEIMGFRLTDNFNAPYFAQSVSEFWKRWHISLSNWFRDYLYIPLGGNRKGKLRKYANIMIVFITSGLWHGAHWSYLIWGGLNGLYQVIGEWTSPIRTRIATVLHLKTTTFSHKLLRTIVTFCLIDVSWVFFRANSLLRSLQIFESIFTADNIWILFDDSLFNLGLDWKNYMVMLASIGVLVFADYFKYRGVSLRQFLCKQEAWLRWMVMIIGIASIFIFGIWGSQYDAGSFIYFQF